MNGRSQAGRGSWRGILLFGAAAVLCALFASIAAAAPAVLTTDGKAMMSIVVSAKASQQTREAAAELATYLGRITGAQFKVEVADGSKGIVVGTIGDFPIPEVAEKLGAYKGFTAREAYAIQSEQARVLLIGGTDLAVPHVVYRFLETLGCRWLFPGPAGEVLPSAPDLSADVTEAAAPAVPERSMWYAYGCPDDRSRQDLSLWLRHNRMASAMKASSAPQSWNTVVEADKAVFDQHPEYLGLIGNKRDPRQVCLSFPEVRALIVQHALGVVAASPDIDLVGSGPLPNVPLCECDRCKQLGTASDQVFGMVNEVARAVAAKYPGKYVSVEAYWPWVYPPSFALEPNVVVRHTKEGLLFYFSSDELRELWSKRAKAFQFYGAYSSQGWSLPPVVPTADVPTLRREIPKYLDSHPLAYGWQCTADWLLGNVSYYVATKLLWNPQADTDELVGDFFDKGFGPATEPARAFYEKLRPQHWGFLTEQSVAALLHPLELATQKAEGRADVIARLDDLKLYAHHVALKLQWDREAAKNGNAKAAALALLTHAYRSRHRYVTGWSEIRYQTIPMAKDFAEPTWSIEDPAPNKPWQDERPFTHEEIEQLFKEDLDRFNAATINEVAFSQELVPVGFVSPGPAPTRATWQLGARYALYSREGEPLDMTLTAGWIPGYRDRPRARYTITDATANVVAKDSLPLDNERHPVTVTVPQAGLYWLDFDDSTAGWEIQVAADRCCVLAPQYGGRLVHNLVMQPLYFYVPKGTTELVYYFSSRAGNTLLDGTDRYQMQGDKVILTVPVKPGRDGQVWCAVNWCLGSVWFYNIPNYFAASPDALLVPKEVAMKDELVSKDGKVTAPHIIEKRFGGGGPPRGL